MRKLDKRFFERDVLEVAPELIGKILVRQFENGIKLSYRITETEAYRGTDDLACHASRGRTNRTEIMYHSGALVYVYLIYGMYWMMNFVAGENNNPQAALLRGLEGIEGPGKITRHLQIDKSFYGEDLTLSSRLWIEDDNFIAKYTENRRIGINYAGEWKDKLWRFKYYNSE
jgi:DNA-3-methyladenine glycosylase